LCPAAEALPQMRRPRMLLQEMALPQVELPQMLPRMT
jgi:hypothetical protein